MEVPSYFTDFLHAIRPTEEQRQALQKGHIDLRGHLLDYEPLKPAIVTTFLQGSYRRSTALRPAPKRRSDVDIIVVTRLHEADYDPGAALELFRPFVEKYYPQQFRIQGRSIGISKEDVDLDLVVTSSPPESVMGILPEEGDDDEPLEEETSLQKLKKAVASAAWKTTPLRIPDREAKGWQETHPLAQLEWTREKNAATDGHFVNVVKAIKWWKYNQHPAVEQLRGYPLERLIAVCCPNDLTSIADGVTRTLEEMETRYRGGKPVVPDCDLHADVLRRITAEEFHLFYGLLPAAARLARRALDAAPLAESVKLWKELFGDSFPAPPPDEGDDGGKKGGFTPRQGPQAPPGTGRFA